MFFKQMVRVEYLTDMYFPCWANMGHVERTEPACTDNVLFIPRHIVTEKVMESAQLAQVEGWKDI